MISRRTLLSGLVLASLSLTACGSDPYRTSTPNTPTLSATSTPTATATSAPLESGTLPRLAATPTAPLAPGGRSTPERAARDFALTWSNWSWRTVAQQRMTLASMARGTLAAQLRSGADANGASALADPGHPGLSAAVMMLKLTGRGARRSGLILTREIVLASDHPVVGGRRWGVYRAQLVQTSRGWKVEAWTAEQ